MSAVPLVRLAALPLGVEAVVRRVQSVRPVARRLMELGLVPGTRVSVTRVAPLGDPLELRLRNYAPVDPPHRSALDSKSTSPGVTMRAGGASGPGGRAIRGPAARPVILVAGNPNSGKSTLFNALTGAHVKVSNYPGVTVTRTTAVARSPGVGGRARRSARAPTA